MHKASTIVKKEAAVMIIMSRLSCCVPAETTDVVKATVGFADVEKQEGLLCHL